MFEFYIQWGKVNGIGFCRGYLRSLLLIDNGVQ